MPRDSSLIFTHIFTLEGSQNGDKTTGRTSVGGTPPPEGPPLDGLALHWLEAPASGDLWATLRDSPRGASQLA